MAAKRKISHAKRSVKRSKRGSRAIPKRTRKYSKRFGYRYKRISIKDFNKYLGKTITTVNNSSIMANSVFPAIYEVAMKQHYKGVFSTTTTNTDVQIGYIDTNTINDALANVGARVADMPNYDKNDEPRGRDDLAAIYNRYIVAGAKLDIELSDLRGSNTNDNDPYTSVGGSGKIVTAIKFWVDTSNDAYGNPADTLQKAHDRGLKIMTLYAHKAQRGKNQVKWSAYVNPSKYAGTNESRDRGTALAANFGGNPIAIARSFLYVTDEEGNPLVSQGSSLGSQFEISVKMTQYVKAYKLDDVADV